MFKAFFIIPNINFLYRPETAGTMEPRRAVRPAGIVNEVDKRLDDILAGLGLELLDNPGLYRDIEINHGGHSRFVRIG